MWKFTINLRWFLTVSIILASLNTISGEKDGPGCVRPQRFDYLILSVTNSGMEAQSQKPSSHSWTIHGLWPQIYGRRGFGYCCAPHQHEFLDRQDLGALEVTLKEFWPSNRGPDFSFWVHEWKRHGTCAQVSNFGSKQNFFKMALKLYFQTNIDAAFARAEMKYNGVYSAQNILNALGNHFGVLPTLRCKMDVGPNQAITEIQFCFDAKTMKRIPCASPIGSCFRTKQLFLAGKSFKRSRM